MSELYSKINELDYFSELVHFENYDTINLNLDTNKNIRIKLLFKQNEYIFCIETDDDIDIINNFLYDCKDILKVYEQLYNFLSSNKNYIFNIKDNFNIFQDKIKTKYKYDKLKLKKCKKISRNIIKDIPKELILNEEQVFDMILSEVDKVNRNFNYYHYIAFDNNNPYELLFRFIFPCEINEKLAKNNDEYIEIKIILDDTLYPFKAPIIKYNYPNMDYSVIQNIENLQIFRQENWNSNISLEWILLNIANNFQKYFNKYIYANKKVEEIVLLFIKTSNLLGIKLFDDFKINMNYVDTSLKDVNKYWKSGTGYGYNGLSKWDINEYLNSQKNTNNIIIQNIKKINELLKKEQYDENKIKDYIYKLLNSQFKGINLLDINKNINLYFEYLSLIKNVFKNKDSQIKIEDELIDEISNIKDNKDIYKDLDIIVQTVYDMFIDIFDKTENNKVIDSEDDYLNIVKKNIFSSHFFGSEHMFIKQINNLSKKNLLRVISEVSSLKKNIPINWDSSCLIRIDKNNTHLIKFIITGPKDTPYHNGIYEFHSYFPDDYPNTPPQVLLKTTDGGKVRFNPNLYNNGKVCLSLLGTWSGEKSEKWNPEISTFLQVIISIQSLILVEEPYFNEPGWEKDMHTELGKKRSFAYKDKIRYQNLKVSIVNQLKNPPFGFKDFILKHFKLKRQEIIDVATKWEKESSCSKDMRKLIDEFIELTK